MFDSIQESCPSAKVALQRGPQLKHDNARYKINEEEMKSKIKTYEKLIYILITATIKEKV